MSGFRGIAKGGWHPGRKDSSSSSSGGGGGGSGWRAKINERIPGSQSNSEREMREARENHVSQPLSSLRDPASFAPPPKHVNYHGAAAANPPPTSTSRASHAPDPATTAATRGLGAPLPKEMVQRQQYADQQAIEEAEAPKPPPGPYKMDTTGLSIANLPKPPLRRDAASPGAASPSPRPPPRQSAASPAARAPLPPPRQTPTPPTAQPRQQPALPPRLPPRQNSHPDLNTPAPPPAYSEATQVPTPDQGAVNRLGQSGISVPGFDIGGRAASPASKPAFKPPQSQMNELQSRFANMSSPSTTSSQNQSSQPAANSAQSRFASMASQSASNPQVQSRLAGLASSPTVRNHAAQIASSPTVRNHAVQHAGTIASANGATPQQASALQSGFSRVAASPTAMNMATQHAGTVASAASSFAPSSSGAAGKKPPPPPPKKKELSDAPPVPLASKPKLR